MASPLPAPQHAADVKIPIEVPRKSPSPPPAYVEDDPAIEEALTAAFSQLALPKEPTVYPIKETCLAHLTLLEAFYALRQEISCADGLWGFWDSRVPPASSSEASQAQRTERFSMIREKRWSLFVVRAEERFQDWWHKVLVASQPNARRMTIDKMATFHTMEFIKSEPLHWTADMLPPLDVLMVWHAFMLSPRNYLEDCIKFDVPRVWAAGMPWHLVHAAIDREFNYHPSHAAIARFEGVTGRRWSNLDESVVKELSCPICGKLQQIPWFTSNLPEGEISTRFEALIIGQGYGENKFLFSCADCRAVINHDALRVLKLQRDVISLMTTGWAIGSTLLDLKTGNPRLIAPTEGTYFPVRLIQKSLAANLVTPVMRPRQIFMADVQEYVRESLTRGSLIASGAERRALSKDQRFAVRKMMSRYTQNHTDFALDLSGAVIRQGVFIEKMHSLDWLHSPTASDTMVRLNKKYGNFFAIMKANPGRMAVPTLDVDLAWHTHQLSPKDYLRYALQETKTFIDHDDKIEEGKLSDAFEWTSKQYQSMFKEVYSECTCWYCESIRSMNIGSSLFKNKTQERVADSFYSSGVAQTCPPSGSAHISSHNAARINDLRGTHYLVVTRLRDSRRRQLTSAYKRACKRAKASGRPEPKVPKTKGRSAGDPLVDLNYLLLSPTIYPGYFAAADPCGVPSGMGYGAAGACVSGACGSGACGGAGGCGGGCGTATSACGGGGGGGGCGGGGCGGGGCGGGGS